MTESGEIDPRLTTLLDGTSAEGELDVAYDGLERDYSARVPEIEWLMQSGAMRERLVACWTLVAWAVPAALRQMLAWVESPDAVPWAADPPDVDDEGVFAFLFDALTHSGRALGMTAESEALRVEILRAGLSGYGRILVGGKLASVLLADRGLIDQVKADVVAAIERALSSGDPDLRRQAAALLGVLVTFDEPRVAELATVVRDSPPVDERVLGDLAHALAEGTGPATAAILEGLASSPRRSVAAHARRALEARRR